MTQENKGGMLIMEKLVTKYKILKSLWLVS